MILKRFESTNTSNCPKSKFWLFYFFRWNRVSINIINCSNIMHRYTMTKSTTIIFICFFAILFGLEKKVSASYRHNMDDKILFISISHFVPSAHRAGHWWRSSCSYHPVYACSHINRHNSMRWAFASYWLRPFRAAFDGHLHNILCKNRNWDCTIQSIWFILCNHGWLCPFYHWPLDLKVRYINI